MIPSSNILLAFGFGNLGILLWLAAVGLPLLIHLWNRRNHREEPFAAVAFILSAVERHARRIRIQHWLLLLVRSAIILLIVLAVAEPFVESKGVEMVSRKRTHKLLVLDGSYSMGYRLGDNSRFHRAKQLATEIVRQSPQGDGFTLILMGEPTQTIVETPAFDQDNFIDEISNLKLPHAGANLSQTLTKIDELLTKTRRKHPDLEQSQVIFISDLGATTWAPNGEEPRERELRSARFSSVAEDASLVAIDLGQPEWNNQFLSSLSMNQPYATTTQPVQFDAILRTSTAEPKEVVVEFLVDGEKIKKERVTISGAGEAAVRFSHRFLEPGSHVIEARIESDLLNTDNHRWLAVHVREKLRVLCVRNNYLASRYLRLALAPIDDVTSLVQVKEISESELIEQDLEQYDAVFLCNINQFSRAESSLLRTYVDGGGGLVLFLGDRVVADSYNQQLGEQLPEDQRILPVALAGESEQGAYQFDPLDYLHPIISPFRDREQAGLLKTPIFRYHKLQRLDSAPTARVVLAMKNGDPAMVEDSIGRGKVIVIAIPSYFDRKSATPWTLFPSWPSFLPIVQETLGYLVASRDELNHSQVGDSIDLPHPMVSLSKRITLESPTDETSVITTNRIDSTAGWSSDETWMSGIYTATPVNSPKATQHFAVNINTRESDLTKTPSDKLPQSLRVQTSWHDFEEEAAGPILMQTGLHRWFLYTVLTLLFAEIYLAWFFGRSAP